jgi:hypothetical protein
MQSKFRRLKDDLSRPRPNCEIPQSPEDLTKTQRAKPAPQNNLLTHRHSPPQTD